MLQYTKHERIWGGFKAGRCVGAVCQPSPARGDLVSSSNSLCDLNTAHPGSRLALSKP